MYFSEVRFSERPEAQKSDYSGGYMAHPTGVLCEVRCNVPSRESSQRTKKVLLSSLSRTQHSSLPVRAAELLKLPLPLNQARKGTVLLRWNFIDSSKQGKEIDAKIRALITSSKEIKL